MPAVAWVAREPVLRDSEKLSSQERAIKSFNFWMIEAGDWYDVYHAMCGIKARPRIRIAHVRVYKGKSRRGTCDVDSETRALVRKMQGAIRVSKIIGDDQYCQQ